MPAIAIAASILSLTIVERSVEIDFDLFEIIKSRVCSNSYSYQSYQYQYQCIRAPKNMYFLLPTLLSSFSRSKRVFRPTHQERG